MLTNRLRANLVQLLQAISPESVRLLLLKHLDRDLWPINIDDLLEIAAAAEPAAMTGLLVELLSGNTAVRAEAPIKHVFDSRLANFGANLRADGYEVIEDALVRLLPGAEPTAQISDSLEQSLAGSDLDSDGEIQRLLRESHESMGATPPDFNDATTKARIALETIARRSTARIASNRTKTAPEDNWGNALTFLRNESVITQAAEEALAKVYTLISEGAHVPRGLTDEQWALLAQTFAVSGAYFLTYQYLAAKNRIRTDAGFGA